MPPNSAVLSPTATDARTSAHAPRWKPVPDTTGCSTSTSSRLHLVQSCPIGNSRDVPIAKGYMSPELLDRIVARPLRNARPRVPEFGLYNWTEPFLHPDLPAMIRCVRSHGIRCSLSTNLNIIRNLDAVLTANPSKIKISLSRFEPETYVGRLTGTAITSGRVKRNLAELADARRRTGSTTELVIGFHRYLGNHDDERVRELARLLGLGFEPQWAYLMPWKKSWRMPPERSVVLQPQTVR
ncbi:MAG: hypothetical protein U0992_00230 [Planctomycetaceae bacterium]